MHGVAQRIAPVVGTDVEMRLGGQDLMGFGSRLSTLPNCWRGQKWCRSCTATHGPVDAIAHEPVWPHAAVRVAANRRVQVRM